MQDAGIVAVDADERGGINQAPRTFIAVERGQTGEEISAETNGVTTLPRVEWRDTMVCVECVRNLSDGLWRNPRHVGEGDDPAARVRTYSHAGGQAGTHAVCRRRASQDLAASLGQQHGQPFNLRAMGVGSRHHCHDIAHGLLQMPRSLYGDRRAIGQRGEQLVGRTSRVKPAAAARSQQHTNHSISNGPLVHQTTSVLSVTSTLLRVALE